MRKHGTNSCYAAGCRRQECREAHRAYERDRTRRIAMGAFVDSDPHRALRDVVRQVTYPQVPLKSVATRAGIDYVRLQAFRRGHVRHMGPTEEKALRLAMLDLLPGDA